MKAPAQIIIIRESAVQSLVSDAGTLCLFVALVGIGVWVESPAMQWAGALVAFLTVFERSSRHGKRLSIEEARTRLDEIEAAK